MAGNKSFMTSLLDLLDDDDFMNKVRSNHSGTEKVDVKDYLSLVKKILDPKGDQGQNKSSTSPSPVPLSSTVNELCFKITWEALHTNNARQTIKSLFDKLSSFPWDAKALLTLSAFSVYYAEHRRLADLEESDYYFGLAAVLRGPRAGKLDFGALEDLIRKTLNFTESTVEFGNSKEFAAVSPTPIDLEASFYQIIFGVIGCSVTFSGVICTSNEFPGEDLSAFLARVTTKYESFKKRAEDLKEELQYKRIKGLYKSFPGIVKIVTELFCTEKDSQTVYHCLKKTMVKVEQFQNKKVMLLISDMISLDDNLATLSSIYNDQLKSSNYEIMWVPVVDEKDDEQFRKKRSSMPWYSCNSIVRKAAAKFIRKKWQFNYRTKVVVLNEKGEVENTDALSMIHLWGLKAIPYMGKRGKELWEEHRNNWLKLVVNNTVFQPIEHSYQSKELIFLYGSAEDSEIVARIEDYLREMKIEVKSFNINTKRKQFLLRLKNCISWMMQVNKGMPGSQTLELPQLYNSYKKQSGFAIVARGSSVMVSASITDLSKVMSKHKEWILNVTDQKVFDTGFLEHCKDIPRPPCYEFSIPNMDSNIPECITCPTAGCTRNMETVITFKCCHGAP